MKCFFRVVFLAAAAMVWQAGWSAGHCRAGLNVGDTVPDFSLTEFGTTDSVDLYGLEGNILLLDFFAYWCPHCQVAASELEPQIDQYYEQLGGNPAGIPVRLVGLSLDNDDPESVRNFIQTYGLELVLEDAGGSVFSQYTEEGYVPQMAIVNGAANANYDQWEILYNEVGYGSGAYETLREIIDSVVSVPQLQAGDANQDLNFNQLDLLQVLCRQVCDGPGGDVGRRGLERSAWRKRGSPAGRRRPVQPAGCRGGPDGRLLAGRSLRGDAAAGRIRGSRPGCFRRAIG